MIEEVRIRITGDAKEIDSTIKQLEKLGTVDKKNAQQFEDTNKKMHEGMKKTGEHASGLNHQFEEMGKRVAAAFAIEKVLEFLGESIKLANEAEQTYSRLNFAVTKVNGESIESFKELVEQSEQLSAALDTLYTPDQIQKGQTMLANAKFESEQIQQLMPRILDIAATTGRSVDEITQKMILTVNSGRNGLKEFGVRFKSTGDVAQDFNNILKSTASFAGGAANALNTASGRAQAMSNKVEELQQRLGQKLAPLLEQGKKHIFEYGESLLNLVDDILNFNFNADTFIHYVNVMGMGLFHLADSAEVAAEKMERLNKIRDLATHVRTVDLLQQEQELLVKINASVGEEHDKYMAFFKIVHEELQKRYELEEEAKKKSGESSVDLHKLTMAQLEERKAAIQEAMDNNELFEGKNAVGEQKLIKAVEKEIEARNKMGESAKKVYDEILAARIKLNESMMDLAKKEADEYRKLLESQKTPLEKENEQHKASVDLLNSMLNQKLISQEDYDKVSEKEEKRHQDALTQIQIDADKKRIGEANEKRAKAEAIRAEAEQKANKEREDAAKAMKKAMEDDMEEFKDFVGTLLELAQSNIEAQIANIDHLKDMQQKSIDQQRANAIAGKQNDLAFEIAEQAKLEKQRMIEQKKLKRAKELEIFLNAVANFSKTEKSPGEAISKAIAEVALVKTVEAVYGEKGALLGFGGERSTVSAFGASRRHPGGGDILLHAQKGEGLLSKGEVAALGGADGFYMLKAALAGGGLNQRRIPLTAVMGSTGNDNKQLMGKMDEFIAAVNNFPQTNIDFDGLGNMIVETTQKGIKEATTYILKKARIKS